MSRVTAVLADDHPLVLAGIRDFLVSTGEVDVLKACSNATDALEAVRALRPDVAVFDVSMPGMSGLQALAAISKERLPTKVIFLAGAPRRNDVLEAMSKGAYGFLSKDCQPDELIVAVRDAASGRRIYPFDLAQGSATPEQTETGVSLTATERKVMELAARGFSNKEISQQLNIATGTTKTHLHHVFRKTGVKNRTGLATLLGRHERGPSDR